MVVHTSPWCLCKHNRLVPALFHISYWPSHGRSSMLEHMAQAAPGTNRHDIVNRYSSTWQRRNYKHWINTIGINISIYINVCWTDSRRTDGETDSTTHIHTSCAFDYTCAYVVDSQILKVNTKIDEVRKKTLVRTTETDKYTVWGLISLGSEQKRR